MTVTDLGLLVLRLALGLTFAAHGAQKAFGWWGGPGPLRWRGAVESMGFAPPSAFAALATANELVGGLLVAVGLLTPVASAALVAQAIVIIVRVHWSKGFFNTTGGYEYPLLLLAVAVVVCLLAAGTLSLDWALGLSFDVQARIAWLVLGIIAGALASLAPRLVGHRVTPPDQLRRT